MVKLTLALNDNQYVYVNPAHVAHVHEEKRAPFGSNETMVTIVTMTTGMAFLVRGKLDEVVADMRGKL